MNLRCVFLLIFSMIGKEIQLDIRLKSISNNIHGALVHLDKPYKKDDVSNAIVQAGLQQLVKVKEDELFILLTYTGKHIYIKTLQFDGKVNYTKLELENKTRVFENDYVTLEQINKAEEILATDAGKETSFWSNILYRYDSDVVINIDDDGKADLLFHIKSRMRKRVIISVSVILLSVVIGFALKDERVLNFIYNLTPIKKK